MDAALSMRGQYLQAASAFEKAIKIYTRWAEPYYNLSQARRNLHQDGEARVAKQRVTRAGGTSPGGESFFKPKLLEFCQWLAETRYPASRGRGMQPSGVRIYYYTLLALLRQHPLALIDLLVDGLPLSLEQRFLDLAPKVAKRLALDLKHAMRLLRGRLVEMELEKR